MASNIEDNISQTADPASDDFARSRIPDADRRRASSVFMVLVGIPSAFFFPATGSAYYIAYGAPATLIGLAIGLVVVIGLSLMLSWAAAREGLTTELLTRGCGYGYAGTILTAIIYAVTFTIYSATEGQILATAIDQLIPLPNLVWYIVVGLIFIPITWYGMSQVTWMMWASIPFFIALVGAAIIIALNDNDGFPSNFFTSTPEGAAAGVLGLVGVMAGLTGTIAIDAVEASDYNRFVAREKFWRSSWATVVLPWTIMFAFAIPLGMFFTIITGHTDPAIYFTATLGVGLGVFLAWISQLRINLTNIHLASIAFSSASERMYLRRLGRKFWIVVVSIASIFLMYFDVLDHILPFLEWTAIFLMAWIGTLIADLFVVRRLLKIVTGPVEYRESRLYKVNPVGPVALIGAIVIGSFLKFSINDVYINGLSAFITLGIAIVIHTIMATWTGGRYYVQDPSPTGRAQGA